MNINPIIDRIADKLVIRLKNIDIVEGIVFFGRYAQKTHDYYSDLDVFIYTSDGLVEESTTSLKNTIVNILRTDPEGCFYKLEVYNKWVIFTEKNFFKIEISTKPINQAKDDVIFLLESRLASPEQGIAFDRNGKVLQIFKSNWYEINDKNRLRSVFLEEIYKFLYYFEGFLSNMAKDDEYRAYVNYTIAFYKLAGLTAMSKGEYYNIYQPRYFTTEKIENWELRMRYYRVSAGLRKYDMLDQRENLTSLFLEVLESGVTRFNIGLEILNNIKALVERFKLKYPPFRNFRDVSMLVNAFSDKKKLREGLIYRSASLSKNDGKLLTKFLKEKKIRFILDLRDTLELQNYIKYQNFYSEDLKKEYIVNIPIKTEVNIYLPGKPYENFYYAFLRDFREDFRLIFGTYFRDASKNSLIIHCEGGKDRTGIVIAILLDLLGVNRKLIMEDYLLSYNDTKREYIDFIFKTIDNEYGGTESYLIDYCKIPAESIKTIKTTMEAT